MDGKAKSQFSPTRAAGNLVGRAGQILIRINFGQLPQVTAMSAWGRKPLWLGFIMTGLLSCSSAHALPILRSLDLQVAIAPDGSYSISSGENGRPVLDAVVAAKINGQWVQSSDYPRHQVALMRFDDSLGAGPLVKVSFTGLASEPDLSYTIRLYDRLPFGDIEVNVDNNTGKSFTVQELGWPKQSGMTNST